MMFLIKRYDTEKVGCEMAHVQPEKDKFLESSDFKKKNKVVVAQNPYR